MYHSTSLLLLPFIAFLLICHANPLSGQSLAFRYQSGRVVQTNPDVVNLDIGERRLTRFTSYHLEMHWQTIGKEEWTQRFNYPAYGLGIKLGDFSMKDKLGLPMSLYGHFSSCFVRRQRLEFYYEFHLGLTFNWKSFEEGVNEYYAASGSKTSVYIAPGIGLRYRINDFVKIASGLSIVHFSNAATRLPNRGINIITPSFQMIFSRSNDLPDFQHRQWEPFRAKNEWLISTFWGQKHRPFRQTEERPKLAPYEQEYFSQYGLQLTFNRHFRYSSKIGIGVDFTIDNAIRTKYSVEESEARGEQI
ncbi:MAG: acyloxyacyl hydrolase, partial [Bacteroidota bacterium]